MQAAIAQSRQGQARLSQLQAEATDRRQTLLKEQAELQALKSRLNESAGILRTSAYDDLAGEIRNKTTKLEREAEDAHFDMLQEQENIIREIGRPMLKVISSYARSHGYAMVIDVSAPGAMIAFSAKAADITEAVVQAFDRANPLNSATTSKPQSPGS